MEPARRVIDVDEEEEAPHMGQHHALVPVEEDSPSKRAKTHALASQAAMDQRQLVNLIQSTIQESVASSLSPMQATVQALADKSSVQDGRLDSVERAKFSTWFASGHGLEIA